MKNIKSFEEFTNESNNVEIFNKGKNSVIAKNKEFNQEAMPDSMRDKDPNYRYVISKKIEIDDKNPVKKFKSLPKFWERRKKKSKKA